MKEKFDENDLFWSRYNGGWMKKVTGLDKSKKNGFSLIGDFVDAGTTKNDYEAGLYINCNIAGSRKNQEKIIQLLKLNDDGSLELLKEAENLGRTWAVEFWELIETNLETPVKMSVDEILELVKDNLDESEIDELFNKLHKIENSPVKVSVSSFAKVERIDDEFEKVLNEHNLKFNELSYKNKSEVLGQAIINHWSFLYKFNKKNTDVEFIKDEHIRKGEVEGYTLYITEKVDGFAKIEEGKLSLRLLY